MPKGFSEREKERIRAGLLAQGQALFAAHGLRKTNVEDLTKAVGISKGAFYLFYDSKEALFFAIIKQFEQEFRATLISHPWQPGVSAHQHVKALLAHAFTAWKTHPLLHSFGREDYAHLLRKLPEERMQAETLDDDRFIAELIAQWERAGIAITGDPKLVAGLLRALFFVSLHQPEFNQEVYPQMFDLLLDLVVNQFVQA
jgi:AcrR family transcriptional regulator